MADGTQPELALDGPIVPEVVRPTTPLAEVRLWLEDHLEEGVHCPACQQMAKVYFRRVTSTSAAALLRLYRARGTDWGHLPTVLGRKQADETKMAYWGLIEEERTLRPDGGRSGWWRVTDFGVQWIRGEVAIARYARVYDGSCLGLEGDPTSIEEALGANFDFQELMAARSAGEHRPTLAGVGPSDSWR